MRSRPFALMLVSAVIASASAGGYAAYSAYQLEAKVARARTLLETPFEAAPELYQVPAAEAVVLLDAALEARGPDRHLRGLRAYAEALAQLARGDAVFAEGQLAVARRLMGDAPELEVVAAAIALLRSELGTADAHLRQALAVAPEDPRALLLASDVALDSGHGTRALELIRRLRDQAPSVSAVHNRLGLALEAEGDAEGALVAFVRAVHLEETSADAWVNLGRMHRKRGDYAEAEDAFTRAVELEAGRVDAPLGRGLARVDRGDAEGAALDFERAASLDPRDPAPLLALGDLARAGRDLGAAVQHYRAALRRDDRGPLGWLKLGNALVESGQASLAVAAFRESLVRGPHLAAAHNGLGTALMRLSRKDEAEAALEEAARLDEADANPWLNLVVLRARSGDRDGAQRAYGRALARDPNKPLALAKLLR